MCVVGAGPGGLACAATLERAGADVVVLEQADVGAAWQSRYDCLHLHTVRWLSGLPGQGIPRSYGKWVSRDGVVEYLREYARRSRLDVRTGCPVERIDPCPRRRNHDNPPVGRRVNASDESRSLQVIDDSGHGLCADAFVCCERAHRLRAAIDHRR